MHAHSVLPLTGMWFGMMAVMMAPTVWPWVRAFHRFGGNNTALFASGYLAAWLAYSIAAAALQVAVGRPSPIIAAAILFAAGAFQFAPLKRACLSHCRNPFSYFLSKWRSGPAGGFRMGVGHGVFCVACCWALMATTLAVGMTNLWWMAALAAATFAEQVTPFGNRARIVIGIGLIASGALQLL